MIQTDTARLRSHLLQTMGIMRRYAVVNGFDGALTMLGLLAGFRLSGATALDTILPACLGAAVALSVSGVTSAYLSEAAERRHALAKLEAAMVTDLTKSSHARAARLLPIAVALVNGAAPLLVSLLILLPLWAAEQGTDLPLSPLDSAIATAGLCIFGLGVFLGRLAGSSLILGGLKALLVAGVTLLLIQLL